MADTIGLASALAAQGQQAGARPQHTSLLPTRIETRATEKNDLGMLEPKRRTSRNPFASEPALNEANIPRFEFTMPSGVDRAFSTMPYPISKPYSFDIMVDNVESSVTADSLMEFFQTRFKSCNLAAKDRNYVAFPASTTTLGIYRVSFSDEKDQQRALLEMQGVYCGNRPMRVTTGTTNSFPRDVSDSRDFVLRIEELGPEVNETMLLSLFQTRFDSCKSARIYPGSLLNSGTVSFSDKKDWQAALLDMDGVYCGNTPIVIGKSRPEEHAALKDEVGQRDARRRDVLSPASDIRTVLGREGLEAYVETFQNDGFETWEQLLDITESDL
jgi:RNA recognition motif-containing protein